MSSTLRYHVRFIRWLAADFPAFQRFVPTVKEVVGRATVLDGDTIVVRGVKVRLHGIDAPELDQVFIWKGRRVACGDMSLAALEALIGDTKVRCQGIEWDPYGRLVAKCYSPNGVDINRRMVLSGWALAYRQYAWDYVDAETAARRAKRGMWRGEFMKPWDHRAAQRGKVRRARI